MWWRPAARSTLKSSRYNRSAMKTHSLLSITLFTCVAVGCSPSSAPSSGSPSDANSNAPEISHEQAVQADGPVQVTEHVSYILEDGEQQHEEFPDTFWIPPAEQRKASKDQLVKLMFQITANGETQTEHIWVVIKKKTDEGYLGVLDNDPYCTDEMKAGVEVRFQPRHVIQIYEDDDSE